MTTMNNQPQSGDIWERDGEWREYIEETTACSIRFVKYRDRSGMSYSLMLPWNRWKSGATLVERKEPTQ
jgi:hypothetical protein